MSEERGPEGLVATGGAADVDKGRVRVGRSSMDLACHELLHGAGLAGDEDRGLRGRGALDLRLEVAHDLRLADQPILLLRFLAKLGDFILELLLANGVADGPQQLGAVQRFPGGVKRSPLGASDRRMDVRWS